MNSQIESYSGCRTSEIPDLVDVDGVVRSSRNAKGQLLALDIEGVASFWRFYRKGPVDDRGFPIVVYHGTKSDIDAFDIKKFGATDEGLAGKGFYFTYNPEEASGYALSDIYGKGESPNVKPVYVALQDPFIITMGVLPDGRRLQELHGGIGINSRGGTAVRKLAEELGHDGVIWANKEGKVLHIVAWRPEQVKSAIGNPGTFNINNPSITDRVAARLIDRLGINDKVESNSHIHEATLKRPKNKR